MSRTGNEEQKNITILQCNFHKNQQRTHSILNDPTTHDYTMLLLQEQYWSKYTESSLMHHAWTLIESYRIPNKPPRSAIYINNRKLNSDSFHIINMPINEVTAVAIKTSNSEKPSLIINVYNPHDYNIITLLSEYLQHSLNRSQYYGV